MAGGNDRWIDLSMELSHLASSRALRSSVGGELLVPRARSALK